MMDLLTLALIAPLFGFHDGEDAKVDPDSQETVLESYDLSGMLPRLDASGWQQSLVPEPVVQRFGLESISLDKLYDEASPDVVLDLITQVLGDELRYEGREITLESNGQLLLLAPEPVQARVRAVLTELRRAFSSSLELQIDVIDLPAGAAAGEAEAGVIEANAAERLVNTLVARSSAYQRLNTRLEPGRTASLDRTQGSSFIFDYDIEIAQGSFCFDPVVLSTRTGARFLLRGVPVAGGAHLAILYLGVDSLGGIKEKAIGLGGYIGQEGGGVEFVPGPPSIQSAEVLVRSLAFDTFLGDGKALVLTSETSLGESDGRQVIVIRRQGEASSSYHSIAVPGMDRKLLLVNAEAFRPPSFRMTSATTLGDSSHHPSVQATLEPEPSNFLFDWLQYRFSVWRRFGPWALVVTDPAWDGDAARSLELLFARSKMESRVGVVSLSLSSRASEAPPLVRWSVPARRRGSVALMVGRSGAAILDYDVEVAQFSSGVDPWVVPTFSGLAAVMNLGGAVERPMVDLRGSGILSRVTDDVVMTQDKNRSRIERLDVQRLDFDERIGFTPSEGGGFTAAVGGSTANGEGRGLSVKLDLR